jgi:hypothetical protein
VKKSNEQTRADKVVTYSTPLPGRQIDLCVEHATDEASGYRLATVLHGAHRGLCEVCEHGVGGGGES